LISSSIVSGIVDAVHSIYANRGLVGFTRGMQARVIFQVPGTALSWSVYELFKFILSDANTKLVVV
jgi:solute carrier family 25 iron transporter 28/37